MISLSVYFEIILKMFNNLFLVFYVFVYFIAFEYIPDSEMTGSEDDLLERVNICINQYMMIILLYCNDLW